MHPSVALRDVVEERTGTKNPTASPDQEFVYVDVAAVDNVRKAIVGARRVMGTAAPSRARKLIRTGDILVSTVRPNLNAVALVPVELNGQVASTGFCILRPTSRVLPQYLFYFVRSRAFVATLSSLVTGAMYPAVSDSQVLAQQLPLPELPEQRRIVDLLAQAEGIVNLRQEAQQKAAELIPAIFIDMFGDPATNPCGWPIVRFETLGNCRLGKMLDKKQQTGLNPKPYLRNINVQWDRIDTDDILTMDFDPSAQKIFRLIAGDVLICEGGEVGRAAVWQSQLAECFYQKALHRLRPDPSTTRSNFVVWLLWHLARAGTLNAASTHATIAHLTGVTLRNLPVICPPIALQSDFDRRVELCHGVMVQQRAAVEKAIGAFDALSAQTFSNVHGVLDG